MPGFTYVAVDKKGKEKKGNIEADTREKVIDILKNDGLIPVSVKEQGALNKEIDFSIGKKVKPRDLSVFCRQFVSITQAGVPMKEALQMLSEQTENKWLKRAISEVLLSVEKGNTLADSMRGQSDIFPPMLINMVEAGENSGSLEMAFTRMAVQFEKEAKLKATIKKATIYPIILVIAAIGVVAVMLLFVIPIFIDMFADLDVEMPGITMWVMNTSEWMTAHWYMILALIILVIVAYKMIYKTEQGRLAIDKVKMKMPLFGKLTVKTACAQFARTMSTLCHMTGIGEETGNIEDMLEKLADYYDEEVEMTTQSVLAAMEPLIIVFMAVVVGTLVVAVVSPIGAMYNGLDNL